MKQQYNKLVRDKITEIIAKNGKEFHTRTLDDAEYKKALLEKLVEESREAAGAQDDPKELTKEIGDVRELLAAAIDAFGLDENEIERVRKERKQSRGGFEKKLFLEWTDE